MQKKTRTLPTSQSSTQVKKVTVKRPSSMPVLLKHSRNNNNDDIMVIEYRKPKPVQQPKVTDNIITQYEYARLLMCRANQLKVGMTPLIEWTKAFDPIAIAKEEIIQGKCDLVIVRSIPDASTSSGFRYEVWNPNEMSIRDY